MPPVARPVKPALELRGASKYFANFAALRSVCFRVETGESVLVYGPNGAGKTTLLRILASLAKPSEGRVLFGEEDLHLNGAAAKAAIGFVSHSSFLYGDLTARENLKFIGTLFGLADLSRKIDAALDLFDVRKRADEPVRELSRGLQQRAALARAFLHDPDYLLLDEPFTGLDARAGEKLTRLLARLPEQGKGLVFSTHDFAQGASLARRLLALEKGQVRFDGPMTAAPLEALGIAGRKPEA